MVQLVDDVYPLIIRYLRQPLPSPTGRNEAPAIRQNGLASVMRVSKVCPSHLEVHSSDISMLIT